VAFNREKAMTAAAKFAAKGQHDRAAKEYVSVIEADPSDTRTWLLLAEALVNAGDKPGAIERYLHVADGYASANEAQKAIAVYRKVLGIDPNRLDIQTRIAGLYKDLGRVGDAVAAYEFVAQAYFQAGQIADGLEGFRMVAELEPAAVGKRLRLAELYSREGMVAQAVEHFRLAAERLLADRRTDDYIRVAERLIYHKEDDLPVLRSLAQIYLKQGENRRALVKLNALLRAAPADAEGLELLGETFVSIGKVDKAISVVMELAREQRKGGRKNKETAARVLRKALQWNPENADDIRKNASEIEAEVALLPPDPEPKDKGELDLDVDVVEDDAANSGGDIDLDVDVEDMEVKVEEVPSRPFAPVGANVAPSVVEAGDEGVGDVDKVLLEARVYVKYKMFEHALGHLDAIFVRDASHLGALELQAQILVELERKSEAADTFVRLAQLVSARDPKQARATLEQAQKLVPDHTKAEMVLAALDSGGSAETAPLLSGLQAELSGDPTTLPGAFDPAVSNSHGSVGLDTSIEPSGVVPVTSVPQASSDILQVTPVGEAAEAEPADPGSDAALKPSDVGVGVGVATPTSEGESATTPPPSDVADTRASSEGTDGPTEGSGTRRLPQMTVSEGSGARKLPNDEGSGARKLAALVNEPITEGSVARKLPGERTPLPIKTFGEKTPLPIFKPPPAETVAKAAGDIESVPVAAEPVVQAAPSSEPVTEGPTAKPVPPRTRSVLKPQRKPAGDMAFKPPPMPSASPEVEELDSGVIEELDEYEVAEVVEPAPRKGPPGRPKPPAKRPPPKPPARTDTAADKLEPSPGPNESKGLPVRADSESDPAQEPVRADSESEPAQAPVRADSESDPAQEPVRADSESEPAQEPVRADSESEPAQEPVRADSESDPAQEPVRADSESDPAQEPVRADSEPSVRADSESEPVDPPVRKDSESEPEPAASQNEPEPSAGDQIEPAAFGAAAQLGDTTAGVTESPGESMEASVEVVAEVVLLPSEPDTEPAAPPTSEIVPEIRAEPVAEAGAEGELRIQPTDEPAVATEAVPVEAGQSPDEPVVPESPASDAPKPAEQLTWPAIDDELDELRFFISGRFEDDAQFAYLDLQRRFPGHPALAEFAERLSTGAKLESAAAPVTLDDAARRPSVSTAPATVLQLDDEDDDAFLSSIFDEPVAPTPGRAAGPRRAVATLEDGADAQTFFDLGTAYREMGLEDDALAQFDLAAKDIRWTARARIMTASLRVQRGQYQQALDDLNAAMEASSDPDERSEAGYELGVLYKSLGDDTRARAALHAVAPGYRDRDELLEALT
jgi:tetratricopeptide (TPR) repeat protein